MTVQPHEIRQRVAASLATELGSGWRESTQFPSDLARDARQDAKIYSVEIPRTTPVDSRSFRSQGLQCQSDVTVRLLQVLKANSQVDSYDAAIAVEATAKTAILSMDLTGLSGLVFGPISRQIVPNTTYLLTEIPFSIRHLIP